MGSEKPSFLSQPVVKNIFMFRNGDPYYEARRIVVNEKRVCNFETLLREVTGGVQAPFGAVRTIYTPRGGHKVDSMESLQSGEQYVAAGRERFKRLDYLQIGTRKKRMMQTVAMQTKPLPTNRISVSARFLKPIKEPCPIFVAANGDILNPAMRLLIHQRMLGQFDRILELITEKMGLKVLGGVRSLYTSEGLQVTDGEKLESGQLYVAVGRERFKKLPYSDLLFSKPRGTRIIRGRKTYSLPPIYRYSKQSGNSKSEVPSSNSEDPEFKTSPLGLSNTSKEHLSSIVREISQSKLLSLRKRKSGQSFNPCPYDDDDSEPKVNGGNSDYKIHLDQEAVEELDGDVKDTEANGEKEETQNTEEAPLTNGDDKEDLEEKDDPETKDEDENSDEKHPQDETIGENRDEEVKTVEDPEKAEEKDGRTSENTTEEDKLASNEGDGERPEEGGEKVEEQMKEADEPSDQSGGGGAAAAAEEQEEEVDAQQKSEVTDEREEEINSKEQRSSSANSDKTQGNKNDGSHGRSGVEEEQGGNQDEDKQEPGSGDREERSNDHVNDVNTGEQKEIKNSNDPERPQSANESKNDASSIVNGNQQEASEETGESQEGEGNGEGTANDDEVEREAQLDRKNSAATTSQ
ncbi:doublecortin domain-containing protein 2 [Oryzias melastigma]|nr:doublecortin domain-containing protein 2 [Oryzias melastigma]